MNWRKILIVAFVLSFSLVLGSGLLPQFCDHVLAENGECWECVDNPCWPTPGQCGCTWKFICNHGDDDDNTAPSVSGNVTCSELGSNDWCVAGSQVTFTASDPDGDSVTISYTAAGQNFSCSGSCTRDLPEGSGTIAYSVSDGSASSNGSPSLSYKFDPTSPRASVGIIGTAGNNDWYTTLVKVTAEGSDATSGIAQRDIAIGGGPWQSSPVTLGEGEHTAQVRAIDQAGNTRLTGEETIKIDLTAPTLQTIIGQQMGANGWHTSNIRLGLVAEDNLSGVDEVLCNLNDAGWIKECNLMLVNDGIHQLEGIAIDRAGNQTTLSETYQVDRTAPEIQLLINPQYGKNGWFVAPLTVQPVVTDSTSGVALVEISMDEGNTWQTPPLELHDGVWPVAVRARDEAGNVAMETAVFKIDMVPPISSFTAPDDNGIVKGAVVFTGHSQDAISGPDSAEISLDGGVNWEPLAIQPSGDWKHEWSSYKVPNGAYTILVRATDQAGNEENTAVLNIIVQNNSPKISLTKSWWIWDSGDLKITENGIPLTEVKIRIDDKLGVYQPVKWTYKPNKVPKEIYWDRTLPNGKQAAPGEYKVTVTACDVFWNCANEQATIRIPFIALPTEVTPSPTPTLTPTPETTPTKEKTPQVKKTEIVTMTSVPTIEAIAEETEPTSNWFIWFLILLLIFLLILLAGWLLLSDKRPEAWKNLQEQLRKFKDGREK